MANVFVIFDREDRHPYIKRGWPTWGQAEAELAGMLRFYPEDHEWRRRLYVTETSPFVLHNADDSGQAATKWTALETSKREADRTSHPITRRDALRSIQETYPEDEETPLIKPPASSLPNEGEEP